MQFVQPAATADEALTFAQAHWWTLDSSIQTDLHFLAEGIRNFFCVSVLPFLKKTGEREMANYASLSHCPSKRPAAQGEKEFAPPAYSRRREKDIFRTQQNGSRACVCNVSLGMTRPPLFSSFRRRLRQNAATFTFVLPFPLYARRAKRGRGEKRGGTTRQKSEAR